MPGAGVPPTKPAEALPTAALRREPVQLPRLSEPELMRHYTRLAAMNYSISKNFYPLGSCTMKYNPVVNETAASLPGFAWLHPYQPVDTIQGALEMMWALERALCVVVGVDRMSLQPAAGAHGEWAGLRMIQAYHPDGRVDLGDLETRLSARTAALMLTNPNTVGLFEKDILEIAEMVHAVGAKLYYDGANLNALMGICRPGDMGFDVVHLNLHKTFTTPHGGGGPGAGPVGVKRELEPFLPRPVVERAGRTYPLQHQRAQANGRGRRFYGNFGMLVRAYTYVLSIGRDGLAAASEDAVLAANYLRHRLQGVLDFPQAGPCKHEFVASARNLPNGIKALDVAKGLLERGFYAPTISFPLIVAEAVMVEPTETESKATLDAFTEALQEIGRLAQDDPERLRHEPATLPVGRLDEVGAARNPVLRWRPPAAG